MLRMMTELLGYEVLATDGEIGKAVDIYFDDQEWTVRHLVIDTRKWIPGRKVLLAPEALGRPDWEHLQLPADLTKEQIKNSPPVDTEKPVSRQHEIELYRYFAWTPYWGPWIAPHTQPAGIAVPPDEGQAVAEGDMHLRSMREVKGYHISAGDGEIGHIEDFILEDDSWIVRYLVIDTRNWLPGKKVLLSPSWFRAINWKARTATTELTRDRIERAPAFDPREPIHREYETQLYDFYGRPHYWHHP